MDSEQTARAVVVPERQAAQRRRRQRPLQMVQVGALGLPP